MLDCLVIFWYNVSWWFMAQDRLNVVIGKRQILREVKKDNIVEIRIAADAEQEYIHSLIELAKQYDVKYLICGSMNEFSAKYGIDVPTGAIGLLKYV